MSQEQLGNADITIPNSHSHHGVIENQIQRLACS